MAARHELEVTIISAKDLKNVNWRYGPNKPYAVVWVDPYKKVSTQVDQEGDTSPHWNETLIVPLPGGYVDEDATLFIDIVHAGDEEDTKKFIGSAKLKLNEVLQEAGVGEPITRSLKLKRKSGRPQGKLEVQVTIRQPRYQPPGGYYAPPYGTESRDYYSRPYDPYAAAAPPPPTHGGYQYGYQTSQPPSGYPYGGASGGEEKKSGRFGGMGTGLAVGAVAGALGGIALVEGAEALEDHIADEAAERVEDDLGYDDEE